MSKTKQRPANLRRYRVLYSVTRSEEYEIDAGNPTEAEERAFTDGEFVDNSGDTTNVISCGIEEVQP